ncbi:AI-2E family transporter [Mycolicibacterium sp. 050158]|uniref:AI-2E family transporter n=1 Tax=Mycolicibacterium sp. 050158 TaxID=3090602 RepID=UPI00299E2DBA|nr:AI-2E family transporter [Mycolicibacterium sp. 050158]MDX1890510.1 AI-2E family transporter [Mycolicibacterium sp. 050158]
MPTEFTTSQKRALAIATVLALAFGAYFLRGYFILIVVAVVSAYLFNPLFDWFQKRFGKGVSVTLTLLSALGAVIVPLGLLVLLATAQISAMVRSISAWVSRTDLNSLGDKTLELINATLDKVPFLHDVDVTQDMLRERMATLGQHAGEWGLGLLQGAAGGLAGGLTAAVLFIYVFISLLSNRERVQLLIHELNPLGDEVTDLYLEKMGAMVRGTVFGQFVIALAQGVAGAVSIYLAGFHQGFFIFAILLTVLSVIPLGGGVVSIPFGIGMILFGNVFGGIFVIAWHLIVVTNIDNVLRPILVPRAARLDSALMLLAVFAGITMFGFLGIVIGPVLMIVIVTTVGVYLWVFKGLPLDDPDEQPKQQGRIGALVAKVRADRRAAKPERPQAASKAG